MSRSSRRSRVTAVDEDEPPHIKEEEAVVKRPRTKTTTRPRPEQHATTTRTTNDDNDEDDDEDNAHGGDDCFRFSSQAPELSQPIFPVRATERGNLINMKDEARQKAVTDLSRLILFKALAGEPIDRLKVLKEANLADKKISSAAFDEAASRLQKVFGYELKRPPKFMEASLPSKFKDRYFVINNAMADPIFAKHCKAIHAVHVESSVEKGLLMMVLAFCFCQGEPRHDGSRWILDVDLYRLLNSIDENIPEEPLTARGGGGKKGAASQTQSSSPRGVDDDNDGDNQVVRTPNVDFLLEKFVYLDYLLKEKYNEENNPQQTMTQRNDEGNNCFVYAMGPRAAMEIGRRQIISFCAEVLEEEIPESMLKEIQDDHEEAEGADMEGAAE